MMYKKIILSMVIISLLTLSIASTSLAKEHKGNKTCINKIAVYNITDDKTPKEIEEEITISNKETLHLSAVLWMNNGHSKRYRYIIYELLDSNDTIIMAGSKKTRLHYNIRADKIYINNIWVVLKNLEVGDYTLKFLYGGNSAKKWPVTTKTVKIHVIPNINSTLTTNSTPNINSTLTT